ncbi:MAG: bifunctional folylpolyglutamate synthase/dihydrofolate synthase, partial [Chthoniobacterales bacterium]|nr:bifunctional folylpolyglutamate synthase/dihydrofolate synthase [Chthoniobacterales bacterium]
MGELPAQRPSAAYQETIDWLFGTQLFGIKLGLESIRRLFDAIEVPGAAERFIHVAGTNGKGSVCAMIDAVCRAAGYRTGLFTSPHLVTYRERIRVNGEMISGEAVTEGLTLIRELVREWEPHPTFFEITTALALWHFKRASCELVVLETGMGGRLDATNAVQPIV